MLVLIFAASYPLSAALQQKDFVQEHSPPDFAILSLQQTLPPSNDIHPTIATKKCINLQDLIAQSKKKVFSFSEGILSIDFCKVPIKKSNVTLKTLTDLLDIKQEDRNAVVELRISNTAIENIDLSYYPNLESLVVYQSAHSTNLIIKGSSPKLKGLEIDRCSFHRLTITDNDSLESIKITVCNNLKNISLDECKKLSCLKLHKVSLEELSCENCPNLKKLLHLMIFYLT